MFMFQGFKVSRLQSLTDCCLLNSETLKTASSQLSASTEKFGTEFTVSSLLLQFHRHAPQYTHFSP